LKTQIEERGNQDYLLSSYQVGIFIGLEKYKKKYMKNRENNKSSHNLLLQ